ncbi:S-layer homology domain-containing protein [Parageobacillus thermoglucosidasius]|uniref:S-layer homology domain-containing protein n=1 Tax=Parageobacillus thermoglucosidasius TaxID=1426 RepID=A0AB38QTR2_PARTM|nr:S-layer homology domain-containing protein [Parageobacillus thermoglucosidasius]KYD18417.1 hypothetical protein B4168_1174 [Anoxybacillus flavithermus]REK58658.1 MAG: S-layer homology domain-containing protein [Geobacillus sp.]AEH47399.1 S-layer domain-containing protein [Parageobacillus thermoglucosidasius C56-YS93]EID44789.1 S-layer homology domain protein [Parageobacillus thermoglucosidasius TNO-09.020]OAO88678.1 hypothetical protein GT23_0334 [Parageobacillus thermoglucosidasius]
MRKFYRFVLVFSLLVSIVFPGVVTEAKSKFKDVPEDFWAKAEIEFLSSKGIIKGYNDGTFKPNEPVKRVQAAIMITRALGLNTSNRPNPGFKDIKNLDKEAYNAIAAVVDEGIFPKGTYFNPHKPLTRGDMAIALLEAYDLKGEYTGYVWDVDKNTKTFRAVNALAANGITKIYEDGTFKPNNSVTRAQFSVFFARTIDKSFAVNARLNPAPLGKTVIGQKSKDYINGQLKYELQLIDVILDGDQAWQMIQAENMFNEPAPAGMKYILAKFKIKALQVQQGSFYVSNIDFEAVSKSGTIYKYAPVVTPSPEFGAELYTGGENEGWVAFLINENDQPTIVWHRGEPDELWFTLD